MWDEQLRGCSFLQFRHSHRLQVSPPRASVSYQSEQGLWSPRPIAGRLLTRGYTQWGRPEGPWLVWFCFVLFVFQQRTYSPRHPASLARRKTTLQPAHRQPPASRQPTSPPARQPRVPTLLNQVAHSLHLPSPGCFSIPLTGSTDRKLGKSRLRQPSCPVNLPQPQFKRLHSVGGAGDAPKPEWPQRTPERFPVSPSAFLRIREKQVFRKADTDV